MKYWRSFVVLFLFCFFGVGSLILGLIYIPLTGLFIKPEKRRPFYCNVVHNLWAFSTNLMQVTGSINLNIDKDTETSLKNTKGSVIVANHPSFIDIVLLIGLIPNSLCVVKKEVKKNPVMSNIVKSAYLINDEDNELLKQEATKALNHGFNVIIFPTGTRTVEGEDMKLHKGAVSLAMYANAPIVPIHISCDYKFLAKHQKILDAGTKPVNYYLTLNETINIDEYREPNLDDTKLRRRLNAIVKDRIKNIDVI